MKLGIVLESFYTGSHKKWTDQLIKHSSLSLKLISLPGRHWKWRMHGASITFAEQLNQLEDSPDFILTSDLIDLACLKGLTPHLRNVPFILYMHENQLNYPWSNTDQDQQNGRNHHYSFINYTSMLAADTILFNSQYHYDAWFNKLPQFLNMFPDQRNTKTIGAIKGKSRVIPLGIDFVEGTLPSARNTTPLILWNHRWEYDKNPELFFETLFELKEEDIPFNVAVLGSSQQETPPIFTKAQQLLGDRIVHWGYCSSHDEYEDWLRKADLIPVTSRQDFFGIAAVEAIGAGCLPLLPQSLAFPEHIPNHLHGDFLFRDAQEFKNKLKAQLTSMQLPKHLPELSSFVRERYDWDYISSQIDDAIQRLIVR